MKENEMTECWLMLNENTGNSCILYSSSMHEAKVKVSQLLHDINDKFTVDINNITCSLCMSALVIVLWLIQHFTAVLNSQVIRTGKIPDKLRNHEYYFILTHAGKMIHNSLSNF